MDLKIKSYLERAENKLKLAKANFELSISKEVKDLLNLNDKDTFFNDVISQSYYCIFYSAKAYLLSVYIETNAPEEHKKTYEKFKQEVENNGLIEELIPLYDDAIEKAETLLTIFANERKNRGRFTYDINANANMPFAKESTNNARMFLATIKSLLENKK
jgi:uncharacterized protein (UPF0332 family)